MSKWQIDRRRFLKGMGAAIALPMLDVMAPSLRRAAAFAQSTALALPKRLAFVYVPNGKNMADWTPASVGADYEIPMILQPLAAHRRDFTLLTGLAHNQANGLGDGGGDHARSAATYLTAHHPRKTSGANIESSISIDQVAANHIGDQTRLPSLELTCDRGQAVGTCESGYSCAYQFNLAWKSATQPMTPEVDPKLVFERLFGNASEGDKAARAKRDAYNKSILDFVMEDASSLQKNLGTGDKRKMDEYLTAIRDIERRIQRDGKFDIVVPTTEEAPVIPDDYNYQQHLRLMYDLMALAFQTDSTRIITFIAAHDGSNRPYPQIGVPDGHHDLSHHRNDEAKKKLIAKINRFHTEQFAYFLAKLKSIKEGEGNLLDHSMIVYGSAISDGNQHLHNNLPILLAGGGGGTLKPGQHLRLKDDTPMANLFLSLTDRLGVKQDNFGDSTGRLRELS
ncbi:MAG TPA: DUF1552 domain-containing protein [Phycisphaerae bacterium]|nr:DUF1552 domain-containing protein [Phycisphaerae bacterium]